MAAMVSSNGAPTIQVIRVLADQRRARPVSGGMQVQDRGTPVELGEHRLELG